MNEVFKDSDKVKVGKADALDLSEFEDDSYDLVLELGPIYHIHNIEDRIKAIREAVRVARKGAPILQKYESDGTTYYFIVADKNNIGGIRIIDKKDGSRKRISPIWIMPEFRNKGYAKQAIIEAEQIYGIDNWKLETILQEEGNIHLYEKLGYKRTGRIDKISDIMDIIHFEKN